MPKFRFEYLPKDYPLTVLRKKDRFQENNPGSPTDNFIRYAEACPNDTDLKFLKALMASGRWEAKYFKRELARAVIRIEASLSSRKN